jgi:circadian clock protein KaiB
LPRSRNARRNLEALCEHYLPGQHTITVVELQRHPENAAADGILGIPCLVKNRLSLIRRLVGDLSDTDMVRKALGL